VRTVGCQDVHAMGCAKVKIENAPAESNHIYPEKSINPKKFLFTDKFRLLWIFSK